MKAEKITALLLTAVLTATAFAGCGEQSNGNATPDEVSSTAQTYTTENEDNLSSEPTDAEATEPTTAQATTAPATTAPATRQEEKTEPVTQPTTAKPVNTAIAVKSISLSSSSLSVTSGSSKTVSVSFNPSNATNLRYNWSISDSSVATVNADGSSIMVTGKNPGTAKLTVTSSNGKTASCSITVNKAQTNSKPSSSNSNGSKYEQAKTVAQKIADASYKIAHKKSSNPTDLELISIACQLVGEYCRVCTYTTDDPDYSTAYGVFIKRVYTCAGSVRALGLVLDCMGYSWEHVNENEWSHQWCELTMDGKRGWADAYNGADFGTYALGAGYGDYDPITEGNVLEQFGSRHTTYVNGSEENGKTVYNLTSWKTYYGIGDEQLIEFFDSNGNFIKRQETINGNIYYEYDVKAKKVTNCKFTADLV